MSEKKIRIRQLPDGRWAASASEWLDFYVMVVRDEGYEAAEDAGRAANLAEPVVTAPTPWEASDGVCEVSGEDLPVEWETLPWPTLRIAHGIVAGVTHILGVSLEARRAIDAVRLEWAGIDGACVACGDDAPWNARESGWRWATCADGDPGWICPPCAAGDVDYEDGFPPPRWP